MKKTKVSIIQRSILHYRVEFYNKLNKNYDIEVIHAGERVDGDFKQTIENQVIIKGFRWIRGLFSKTKDSDIIVFPFDVHWVQIVLVSLFRGDKKLVFWGHGLSKSSLANKLKIYLLKKCDALMVYMPKGKEVIVNQNPDFEKKIFVAYNSMHVSNPAPQKQEQQKKSFLFVGRLQKRKKIDQLIEAFYKSVDKISDDIVLRIVGDGEILEELKELSKKLGIENRVIFEGSVTDDERLIEFFHDAFAYVSPGWIGLGVIHSLAYGTPVITRSDIPHAPEYENLVDGDNSLLYNDSVDNLSAILVKLEQNKELQVKLSQNAYKHYEVNCSLDNMVANFEKCFECVLKNRKGANDFPRF